MNNKLSKESLNITQEKIEQLKKIFPEVVSENKVDFERLKLTLGENIKITDERYVLNWANKSDVFTAIQTPTTKTLQPLKEDSVNFDTTQNIFIEGENLEVLKILQKSYFNKIKMIYIDPPYNTGSDSFIYPDKYAESKDEYLKKINEKDEEGYLLKEGLFRTNSKENGQFHSNWLSMMYPRLFLAKNLLKDDGVIFVSIDDNEVHNLRMIMNEIFGEENFLGEFVKQSKVGGGSDSKYIVKEHEYCVVYAKSIENLPEMFIEHDKNYLKRYSEEDENGKFFWDTFARPGLKNPIHYDIVAPDGSTMNYGWIHSEERFKKELKSGIVRIVAKKDGGWSVQFKQYLNENGKKPRSMTMNFGGSIDGKIEINTLFDNDKLFTYPKSSIFLKELIKIIDNKNNIILDFFAGSGTTAQAVMELNKEDDGKRKFILVQLPEKIDEESEAYKAGYKTISEISKERIRRAIKKISSEDDMIKNSKDIDLGFKSYRLKESNFKIWRSDIISSEEDLKDNIDMFEDSLKQNTKNENILTELLLKSGYDLNTKKEIIKIDSSYIYIISDKELIVCLDKISKQIIDKIIEINPSKCFILDSLFEGKDSLKTNISLQLEDAKINLNVV